MANSRLKGEPVKIGAPHFVDFGKNMEHSPDGKAYLVAHGASDGTDRRFGYNSWITGDEIYLMRVTPRIENMNDASKYEFFDGTGLDDSDFAQDQADRRVARQHGLRDDDLQRAAEEVPDVRDRRHAPPAAASTPTSWNPTRSPGR